MLSLKFMHAEDRANEIKADLFSQKINNRSLNIYEYVDNEERVIDVSYNGFNSRILFLVERYIRCIN